MTRYIFVLVIISAVCFSFSEAYSSPVVTTVCHGRTDDIMCGNSKRIQIISATWGRKEKNICGLGTKVCEKDVKGLFQTLCDTQKFCTLMANTVDLPNYCKGTSKYLEVIHKCV